MVKEIDNLNIDIRKYTRLESADFELKFSNQYKLDKAYITTIDTKTNLVNTVYRGIKFEFTLPTITVNLSPPLTYFSFKKTYKTYITNTVHLEYLLSLYYVISLNTFIKDNINKDF